MSTWYVKTPANGGSDSNSGSISSPFATPGKAMGVAAAGDDIFVQSGTYTCTTSTANVTGGVVSFTGGVSMQGYAVTPGDLGTPPVISAGSLTGVTLVTLNGTFSSSGSGPGSGASSACINITVDGAGNSGVIGFTDATTYARIIAYCAAKRCVTGFNYAGNGFQTGTATFCSAQACTTGFSEFNAYGCWASGCTTGFNDNTQVVSLIRCIASGGGSGFLFSWGSTVVECVAANNSGNGFGNPFYDIQSFTNCIATGNGGYGFASTTGGMLGYYGCGGYNNASGLFAATPRFNINPMVLTADPWMNASSGDFRPNTTAGGGAVLRAAGIGVYGQINAQDAGAVQSAASGGGGSGSGVSASRILGGI